MRPRICTPECDLWSHVPSHAGPYAAPVMVKNRTMPSMDGPAKYRIRVRGRIDPSWLGRISGMATTESLEDGEVITTLVGSLADQAALSGVLNTLYELHLPVLSTEWLDESSREEGPNPRTTQASPEMAGRHTGSTERSTQEKESSR